MVFQRNLIETNVPKLKYANNFLILAFQQHFTVSIHAPKINVQKELRRALWLFKCLSECFSSCNKNHFIRCHHICLFMAKTTKLFEFGL